MHAYYRYIMARLRTALFINAHSRRARHFSERVIADFTKDSDDLEIVETIVVHKLDQFDYHLEILKAIKDLQVVIVGSGDGSIVAVLNALKDRDIIYGFLPLGTSNTFVRSLGLPINYKAARQVILKGMVKQASVGAINGQLFANIAGIGVPAHVSQVTTNKLKRYLGPLAYAVTGVRTMLTYRSVFCQITNDELNESFYTNYLLFANGPYHGPLPLGKEVSVYNDQLMLIAIGVSQSPWQQIIAAFSVIFRRHHNSKRVKMIPFKRILITTQPKRNIEADGEIIGQTPATVEIMADAIKVFTDASEPAERKRRRVRPRRKTHTSE